MSDEVQRILREAMHLSPSDRLELVAVLTDTLGEGKASAEIDDAWMIEIDRRLQAVRDRQMPLVPADEVDREIDAALARRVAG